MDVFRRLYKEKLIDRVDEKDIKKYESYLIYLSNKICVFDSLKDILSNLDFLPELVHFINESIEEIKEKCNLTADNIYNLLIDAVSNEHIKNTKNAIGKIYILCERYNEILIYIVNNWKDNFSFDILCIILRSKQKINIDCQFTTILLKNIDKINIDHIDKIFEILINQQYDYFSEKNEHMSPLSYALIHFNEFYMLDIIKLMLKNKIKYQIIEIESIFLNYAKELKPGTIYSMELLLSYDIIDVNCIDHNGDTALHLITKNIYKGDTSNIVKLLREYGADSNIKNNKGISVNDMNQEILKHMTTFNTSNIKERLIKRETLGIKEDYDIREIKFEIDNIMCKFKKDECKTRVLNCLKKYFKTTVICDSKFIIFVNNDDKNLKLHIRRNIYMCKINRFFHEYKKMFMYMDDNSESFCPLLFLNDTIFEIQNDQFVKEDPSQGLSVKLTKESCYLMVDDTGRYKIGKTSNYIRRKNQLKTGNAENIHCLAITNNVKEIDMHRKYDLYRIDDDSEWFHFDNKIMNDVVKNYINEDFNITSWAIENKIFNELKSIEISNRDDICLSCETSKGFYDRADAVKEELIKLFLKIDYDDLIFLSNPTIFFSFWPFNMLKLLHKNMIENETRKYLQIRPDLNNQQNQIFIRRIVKKIVENYYKNYDTPESEYFIESRQIINDCLKNIIDVKSFVTLVFEDALRRSGF